MKKKDQQECSCFVHCESPIMFYGFKEIVKRLPQKVECKSADFSKVGIMSIVNTCPKFLVLLEYQPDSCFILYEKLRFFAPDLPVLIITPPTPITYKNYIESIAHHRVLEMPFGDTDLVSILSDIINSTSPCGIAKNRVKESIIS